MSDVGRRPAVSSQLPGAKQQRNNPFEDKTHLLRRVTQGKSNLSWLNVVTQTHKELNRWSGRTGCQADEEEGRRWFGTGHDAAARKRRVHASSFWKKRDFTSNRQFRTPGGTLTPPESWKHNGCQTPRRRRGRRRFTITLSLHYTTTRSVLGPSLARCCGRAEEKTLTILQTEVQESLRSKVCPLVGRWGFYPVSCTESVADCPLFIGPMASPRQPLKVRGCLSVFSPLKLSSEK